MSSILKSLKKLEEEKAGQKQGSSNVSRDILKGDVPKRKSKRGPSWVVMILLVALVAGAVIFLRSPAPHQVAETSPSDTSQTPSLPAGEQAGNLGAMMERTADFYDDEMGRWIEWFVRLFEPLLMVFVGAVIGVVVILMYIPIFELDGSIR